jgi:hypothetical protein
MALLLFLVLGCIFLFKYVMIMMVTVHSYPVNVTAYAHLKSPGGHGAYALPP